jgi:hypothetical protein
MDIQHRTEELSLQIFDQPSFPVHQNDLQIEISSKLSSSVITPDQVDENNDSSTSTTTSRSVHLPVEKQRGLSEIIRKRNSKCKVEDYKRSIQKPNILDDEQSSHRLLPISNSNQESMMIANNTPSSTPSDLIPKYFEVPIDIQNNKDKRVKMSIERLNLLLSKDEQQE